MVIYMVEIHPITWLILIFGAVAVGVMALFMGRGSGSAVAQQNTDTTSRVTGTQQNPSSGAQPPQGAGNSTAPNAYLSPVQQLQSQSLTQQVANNGSSSVYFAQLATMYGFSFQDIQSVYNSLDNRNVIITFKDGHVQSYANPAYVTPVSQSGFTPQIGGAKSTEPATRKPSELTFVDQLGWVDKFGVIYIYDPNSGSYVLRVEHAGPYYNSLPATPIEGAISLGRWTVAPLGDLLNSLTGKPLRMPTTQSVITMDNGSGIMQPYLIQYYNDGTTSIIGPASAQQSAAADTPSEVSQPPTLQQVLEKDQVASTQQTGVYTYKLTSIRNYDYGSSDPRGYDNTWTGYDPTGAVVDKQKQDPTLTLDPKRVKRVDNMTYLVYGWPYFDITPPAVW